LNAQKEKGWGLKNLAIITGTFLKTKGKKTCGGKQVSQETETKREARGRGDGEGGLKNLIRWKEP